MIEYQAGPEARALFDWLGSLGDGAVLSLKAPHAAANIVGTPILWPISRSDLNDVTEDLVTSRELAATTPPYREPAAHVHVAQYAGDKGWGSVKRVHLKEARLEFHPHVTHRVSVRDLSHLEVVAYFIGCGQLRTSELQEQMRRTGMLLSP